MRKDNKAEIQHYVPKFLLRRFAFGKPMKEKIHVFDKQTDQEFSPALSGIVAERSFNDFQHEDIFVSLEPSFTTLEQHASDAIARVVEHESLAILSDEERAWLATFVAAQHLRVRQFREAAKQLDDAMRAKVDALGYDIDQVEGYEFFKNDEEIKKFSLQFFVENIEEFSSMVLEKSWYLIKTTQDRPFLLSDNPVALHNDNDMRPYGNIGFMVRGIQIYLPLSQTLCLAMWCPDLAAQIVQGAGDAKASVQELQVRLALGADEDRETLRKTLEVAENALARMDSIAGALRTGGLYLCSAEHQMFLNSTQIRWAQRYVLGPRSEFSLARRMMKEKPHLRVGRRFTFG